jgi:hypothetical protein
MQKSARKPDSRRLGGFTVFKFFKTACAFLALFMLFSPSPVKAQMITADILGTVTDSTGAVLAGAKVTIKNTGTGISRSAETGKTGDYTFTLLQIGSYEVTIESKGFRKFVAKNINLTSGDRARINATMTVGQATETVNVSADSAAALQTDSSTVGTEIPSRNIQDVPLSGRNITDLVLMSAGVTGSVSDSLSNGKRSDDSRASSAYVVNGQSDLNQNNQIDGMDNNDRRIGVVEVKPSIDAIEEVKVQTSLYSAESGRTAGGLVQIVTKSGSNKFKGSAYEYVRNDMFDAWDKFATVKPILRQNQFGGSIGGPIVKNKTFFFSDFEAFRNRSSSPSNSSVPTAALASAVASGDISAINTAGVDEFGSSNWTAVTSTISPVAQNLFKLYPSPTTTTTLLSASVCGTTTGVNYCKNTTKTQHSNTFDTRIDQHFNDKNTLYGRYSYNKTETVTMPPFPSVSVGSTKVTQGGITAKQPEDNVALDYVHIFRPSLLLNIKAGYTYSANLYAPSDTTNVATSLGFDCDSVHCINTAVGNAQAGLPTIGFGGGGPPGAGTSQVNLTGLGEGKWVPLLVKDHTYQYSSSLTWTTGAHSFKFGVGSIRRQVMGAQSEKTYGEIDFESTATFLEGTANGKSRVTLLVNPHLRTWEPSVYAQDDWRVKPWLTLNLGIRYDLFTPYTEENGYLSNFDPSVVKLVSPTLLGDQHSNKYANVPTDFSNLAPRIGFSASLPHGYVLRGGFGTTYYPNTLGPNSGLTNAPFQYSVSCGTGQGAVNFGSGTCADMTSSLKEGIDIPKSDISLATNTANYAGITINSVDTKLKSSYLYQYSLQTQKEWRQNIITVGYVGNLGRHLANYFNPNGPVAMDQYLLHPDLYLAYLATGTKATDYAALTPTGGYLHPSLNQYTYNPDGTVSNISTASLYEINSEATSKYNALQATFVRRSTKGLTTSINYTWAHLLNNGYLLNEGAGQNPTCVRAGCPMDTGNGSTRILEGPKDYDYGNGDLDVRHRISGVLTYTLPFAKNSQGIVGAVAKGWNANMMGVWQTGMPTTTNNSLAGGGGGGGGASVGWTGVAGDARPNQTCKAKRSHATIYQWYNLDCFELQQPGTYGNERRNQIFGPGMERADISMTKIFDLHESFKLQLRMEGFNITNTPELGQPAVSLGCSNYTSNYTGTCGVTNVKAGLKPDQNITYSTSSGGGPGGGQSSPGTITSTNGNQRQFQFALKLMF